jgi:NOL1/NOP2/fmu family ribosome biogenesis protein
VVTNNDPADFQRLENYFDVIVVDAPCSGSGLFRRDAEAIEEWSEQNVALCSQRQQRILADVLPSLKNGGVLIYSTCSYSKAEDEEICEWLKNELLINNEELRNTSEWNIVQSDIGYRFWPDKVKGEGFFIACFRKKDDHDAEAFLPKVKAEKFSKREIEIIYQYAKTEGMSFIRNKEMIHAVRGNLLYEIVFLLSKLKVINSGTKIGEIMKDKLVPDHALAMSNIVSENVQAVELDYDNAIRYLKRKELNIEVDKKGWALVTYQDHPLGWVNILPNRINNYYPKELRILKD